MFQKMKKSKGFTLIEMLVVIAIIAILVAIIIPTVSNSNTKAKAAANAANLRSLKAEVVTKALTETSFDYATYVSTRAAEMSFYALDDNAENNKVEVTKTGDNYTLTWEGKDIADWAKDAGNADAK